jgi:hypothetical protein
MKKKAGLLIFLIFSCLQGFSQNKTVSADLQLWTQYSFLGRFSPKWSLYFDYVDRTNDILQSQNAIFLRPGLAYDLTENTSMYAGYCYSLAFEDDHTPEKLTEHRLWQQLLYNTKSGKLSFQHRYRLEERFNEVYKDSAVADEYSYTWRMRYKLNLQYPVWKSKDENRSLSILLTDEIITSFGRHVILSYFNQNRLFLGLSLQFSKKLSASFGYTDIFRSTGTAGHYVNINAPTINLNQKLDFRKQKG